MIDRYDQESVYCRMLGHILPFRYCRTMNNRLPCSRILDCWFELLPIQQFVARHYSLQQQQQFLRPPDSRMDTLLNTLGQLQKGKQTDK